MAYRLGVRWKHPATPTGHRNRLHLSMTEIPTYTVSRITRAIKEALEDALPPVWVDGEISDLSYGPTGHLYFSLIDPQARLPCVMWREYETRLLFTPENGMQVMAYGTVTVYEKGGRYQLSTTALQQVGAGELAVAFERMKAKLAAEGLFDEERKRPLPPFPDTVAVVTSPASAAFRDMVKVLKTRAPHIQLLLAAARVQGDGAAETIASAIDLVNAHGEAQLLIVGRGGGSAEDLAPFNTEEVARAIFRSRIPVVSAVGHEIDVTIADFVADIRAPTPTAAAVTVAPERQTLFDSIDGYVKRAAEALSARIYDARSSVDAASRRYGLRRLPELVAAGSQRLDEATLRANAALNRHLRRASERQAALDARLLALNPEGILRRGYSIVYDLPSYEIVRRAVQVEVGGEIEVKLAEGKLTGEVLSKSP